MTRRLGRASRNRNRTIERPDPVRVRQARVSAVRAWFREKKKRPTCAEMRRCARDLGLRSTMVQDALAEMGKR